MRGLNFHFWSVVCLVGILCFLNLAAEASNKNMVNVPGGKYKPFFKDTEIKNDFVEIQSLSVDKYPVSNKEYAEFVSRNPGWARGSVKSLFADSSYLKHWNKDGEPFLQDEGKPVVYVSWFAANAYCKEKGARLMTVNEWEFVADASSKAAQKEIMQWYAKTNDGGAGLVSKAKSNKHGLFGMHGLIWEWVFDFNSVIIKGDSRSANDREFKMFCGSGSLGALSPEEYATFMRFAFRSGLKANYSVANLGFRCAREVVP